MHYFTIHSASGVHLGFLVLSADDENAAEFGSFAVKRQELSQIDAADRAAAAELDKWQNGSDLRWCVEKDRVNLYVQDEAVGSIRQEHLRLGSQHFVLNDLTGAI